ncbi:hypothetical protein [uncultured Fusobacterium sp.]|uniref:hypothetical protein n=1 Tax=uncultured Fusobacterium sp. TaxID=159267 RepID=UPI00259260D1|nr:hypothetical protein [uncultured Fusobacterium sp.]
MKKKKYSDKKALFGVFFPKLTIILKDNHTRIINRGGIYMFQTLGDFYFLIDQQFSIANLFALYPDLKEKYQDNIPRRLVLDDSSSGKKLWEVLEENCIEKLYNDWNNLKNLCEKYCTINKNTSNFNELLKQL